MTTLALTHGEASRDRIERGLAPHGVECVAADPTGGAVDRTVSVSADVGLVFPGRLVEGTYLDAVSDLTWLNDAEDVLRSRNKAASATILDDAGLRVPSTRMVSEPFEDEDVDAAVADLSFPVVVKQNAGTRGRGAALVHDRDSLLGIADQFRAIHRSPVFDNTFVVQEFLPDARDLRVMTIDGEYVGAVERRSSGWAKNVHRGAVAEGVRPDDGAIDAAERAADALDIAFCGVDVLVADGEPWVLEVNAKPTVDDAAKYESDFFETFAHAVEARS